MIIAGYDPGGKLVNGVAVLEIESGRIERIHLGTCDFADEALDFISHKAGTQNELAAIGIDSLLSWSTGASGWRPMDIYLRGKYPPVANSVVSSNSARGAMAVQGIALAIRIRAKWADAHLNETHPKVLYYALTKRAYNYNDEMITWLISQFNLSNETRIANEHEWDALISALFTWQSISGIKTNDLMLLPNTDMLLRPAGEVTYYWPADLQV